MKLVFLGDLQFGRDNIKSCKIKYIRDEIKNKIKYADAYFFNLETVFLDDKSDLKSIKLKGKPIHIYTKQGKHNMDYFNNIVDSNMKYLNNMIPKNDIFVSLLNNHTLDYGIEGYNNTIEILNRNNMKCTYKKSYYIDDNFIYLNATDHWTEMYKNLIKYPHITKLYEENFLFINTYEMEIYTYKLIKYLNKIKGNRTFIFSIHYNTNFMSSDNYTNYKKKTYLSDKYELFFKKICDLGVDIIFGHGYHHQVGYEKYKDKLIIYGLGDFTGDFKYYEDYESDKNIILIFNTENTEIEEHHLDGDFKPYNLFNTKPKCKVSFLKKE
jgi:poly-gamma-glutamate synthesis protein (capsule biosynthesis protein)|uniref:Capsule synthesis protein CapA domain-containing protein n=1 Tax=viral metagenome TaxID=1070528 RepID=A0A6C0C118_9ZZZZ